MTILIIGASVAGTRAAVALRQRGYEGDLVLLEAEEQWPYDKPPLSKGALNTEIPLAATRLLSPQMVEELNLDLRLNTAATALDPAAKTVTTSTGEQLAYEKLIIATGSSARALPVPAGLSGVHTLRTLDDAALIRGGLAKSRWMVVIGAGFIGSEIASVARSQGIEVTILEALDTPMSPIFGDEVGREISSIHELNGARLLTGVRFEEFVGEDQLEGVTLSDGTFIAADLAVVGIGAIPGTDWLAGSGLPVDRGIQCEDDLQVVGFPDIYAIGDLAIRQHPTLGFQARVEHWTNAGEHAEEVAALLTGSPAPKPQLPYVWSDQYDSRFQIIGRPSLGVLCHQEGSIAENRYIAIFRDAEDNLVGEVSFNDNKAITAFRKAYRKGTTASEFITGLTPAAVGSR